ncbi:hypothetical protein ASZ90_019710 [hydrocarbon metagenome]|uniref:Uncharacterized protein n=1 Tax=hydrocarbon metagenome TaxID=938273 RepID=A0A0W8E2S3_9ZZZZ
MIPEINRFIRSFTVFYPYIIVTFGYRIILLYGGNINLSKKLKLGRNDPCPCGSGKKYKNCCGLLGDITPLFDDPFTYYNQLAASTKLKLDRYFSTDLKKHRQTVKSRFTRYSVSKSIRAEHESVFSDWLWFDVKDDSGTSMAGIYLAENQAYMELPLREYLQALNASYLSVYRIVGSAGIKLDVTDIFMNSSYQVIIKEPLTLNEDKPQMLLLGRMVCLPKANLFSGMVLMLENNLLQEEFIKEHVEYLKGLYQCDIPHILKNYGEIIYGIFDHAAQKMLVNLNDMRLWMLDENERESLLDRMLSGPEYLLQHETAGFYWFKSASEIAGYSRIVVGEDMVLSCSDVLEDVIRHNEFIDSILPDQPVQVLNSHMLQSPPDPEYAWLWFLALKDRECEKWFSTEHRELNGKTPREVLLEEGGAKIIISMLDNYLGSIAIEEEKEVVEYIKLRCQSLAE